MAVALETVVKQLEDSGIVAAGKLKECLPPKASPKDAEELVRELVKQNHLTRFQAQHVAAGKTKSLILGGYTILDKIGAGGMGQVFKALHRRMDRVVAIKMLPPAMTKDAAAVARFEREVRAAAKLEHPNIVAAHDADQANGVHFLVMQYVEGSDLSALVKKDGPFSVAKAVNYVLQAARGLEFAHGEGVVHRDIKPANLLLDKKGVVKILDMGLARIEQGDGPIQAELTGTGAIMGTVDYMAPEQGMSTKHADARADIYSLGCTLYFLLIGKATYGGETVAAKLVAHHNNPIPNLCQLREDVPGQVDAVFRKMVAKKIEDRYQNMTDVVTDLEQCQGSLASPSSISHAFSRSTAPSNEISDLSIAFGHQPLKSLGEPPQEYVEPAKKPRRAKTAKTAKTKPAWSRPALIGLVAAGVVGIGISLAVVIIKMRTQDGTLIVEVNQPDALVQVLDGEGKVEISQPGGLKPISISVVPGKHRLRVEKDGFVAIADNIEIQSGGKLDIKARLVPKPKQVAGQPNQPWNTPAFQAWMKTVAIMPAHQQVEAVAKKLMELNPGFDGKLTPGLGSGVVSTIRFSSNNVTDISPLRAFVELPFLSCDGNGSGAGRLSDLSPLQGMEQLATLQVSNTQVSDLSPLKGSKLTALTLAGTPIKTLSPLQGMPLTYLSCDSTQVSDLSPLAGMPLTNVSCRNTPVSDLSPLQSCKSLKTLRIATTNVTAAGVAALQKALPNCKIEWDGAANVIAGKPSQSWDTPVFQAWVKSVQALPAEKQIEAVRKKLMELNSGFDGKVTPKVEIGAVTEFDFFTDDVTDISPVRALAGLKDLRCNGSAFGAGKLFDLSPLRGMALTTLSCAYTKVPDLSPLEGMPLTILNLDGTRVSDLSPLRGMQLAFLRFATSKVADLSPLQGMPLKHLYCPSTQVSELSPLQGMPLTELNCYYTPVSDVSPLHACRHLETLVLTTTKVTAASVAALQKALPNCKIEWDGAEKPKTP